jgi:hypothetical protein
MDRSGEDELDEQWTESHATDAPAVIPEISGVRWDTEIGADYGNVIHPLM